MGLRLAAAAHSFTLSKITALQPSGGVFSTLTSSVFTTHASERNSERRGPMQRPHSPRPVSSGHGGAKHALTECRVEAAIA